MGAANVAQCKACCDTGVAEAAAIAGAALAPEPKRLGAKGPAAPVPFCCADEPVPQAEAALKDYRLLAASADGDLNSIRAMLESGADIEARRPLVFAETTVKQQKDPDGDHENLDFQEVLVVEGHGVVQTDFGLPDGGTHTRNQGFTPLMRAAKEGRALAVSLLLEKGAKPNSQDEQGRTALHLAAAAGCRSSCKALVKAGADRDLLDDSNRNAYAMLPREFVVTARERLEWQSLLLSK